MLIICATLLMTMYACTLTINDNVCLPRAHVFLNHYNRSESPSQVFLIVVSFLYKVLKDRPEHEWENIILAYDNMCHLDALKVANAKLPLPAPYCNMWLKVTKIIDSLHIRNHVDKRCLEKYHPRQVKEKFPKLNLMAAEQAFVWASRYKKVLCSMTKTHHCFFLHRLGSIFI